MLKLLANGGRGITGDVAQAEGNRISSAVAHQLVVQYGWLPAGCFYKTERLFGTPGPESLLERYAGNVTVSFYNEFNHHGAFHRLFDSQPRVFYFGKNKFVQSFFSILIIFRRSFRLRIDNIAAVCGYGFFYREFRALLYELKIALA